MDEWKTWSNKTRIMCQPQKVFQASLSDDETILTSWHFPLMIIIVFFQILHGCETSGENGEPSKIPVLLSSWRLGEVSRCQNTIKWAWGLWVMSVWISDMWDNETQIMANQFVVKEKRRGNMIQADYCLCSWVQSELKFRAVVSQRIRLHATELNVLSKHRARGE